MHPILARPARLALYVATWVPPGVLLATLLALQGVFSWRLALATAIPLSIAYGFLCLSAWYVASTAPVDRAGPLRILTTASLAAFMSSAVWLLMARGWVDAVANVARLGDVTRFRAAAPTLFGFGFLLYLLAMA